MAKIQFEVDPKSFKKFQKDFITLITSEIFTKSQENLVKPDEKGRIITDTGELLQSGSFDIFGENAKILYDAPHAEFIEFGTPPHAPPFLPIFKWAKRKLGLPEKQAKQVARRIINKIKRSGTLPKRFLRNAIDEVRESRL